MLDRTTLEISHNNGFSVSSLILYPLDTSCHHVCIYCLKCLNKFIHSFILRNKMTKLHLCDKVLVFIYDVFFCFQLVFGRDNINVLSWVMHYKLKTIVYPFQNVTSPLTYSYHEFHETCHSVTFIVLVNSHQR